jgi:hypothetical protein
MYLFSHRCHSMSLDVTQPQELAGDEDDGGAPAAAATRRTRAAAAKAK